LVRISAEAPPPSMTSVNLSKAVLLFPTSSASCASCFHLAIASCFQDDFGYLLVDETQKYVKIPSGQMAPKQASLGLKRGG